ncbi:MAG: hypothetical protein QOE84_762 [Actinomycetota bacterium]|jgi:uncharacterized protein with NRDE domain|nr:hypothetical protein [Actinomycetota bacterium]
MSTLDDWAAAVAAELGLTTTPDVRLVLDLARDAAHAVERPAAPLTTWLAGMAVAAGADAEDVAARITALAATWAK